MVDRKMATKQRRGKMNIWKEGGSREKPETVQTAAQQKITTGEKGKVPPRKATGNKDSATKTLERRLTPPEPRAK